ncbi:MAG TPA: VIT1/CCC1 transporter family protein [Candidatus Thermoplasmatota archaeon]|nr:VIT1/CCC1 transporter family protein [Candidatus Thermoplasmatota archaeon]
MHKPAAADGKTLPELKAEHRPQPPARGPPRSEASEQKGVRNYVRDLILGFNDGVVSVYAACAGVAGAALGSDVVGVAGVAAGVAGALSMGLGEYISTKSQTQYYEAEARRERDHIRAYPQLETEELKEMMAEKGYPAAVQGELVRHLTANEDRFVEWMMREEFGVGKESARSPVRAMLVIALAFIVGALLPVLPFFLAPADMALAAASVVSVAGLFAAGWAKARVAGLPPLQSGLEMAVLGSLAALVTYGVGTLFGVVV